MKVKNGFSSYFDTFFKVSLITKRVKKELKLLKILTFIYLLHSQIKKNLPLVGPLGILFEAL